MLEISKSRLVGVAVAVPFHRRLNQTGFQQSMRKMTFPGRLESLVHISEFITQAARDSGLSDDDVYEVELAVDEACTNIVEHAYANRIDGEIKCAVFSDDEKLTIILRDDGTPFNPKKVPKPNPKLPLQKVTGRGAGLFLMYKMMDEVNFEFSPDEGNTLTMVKLKK
jgi:serine/threonine-protein kinase RsbW